MKNKIISAAIIIFLCSTISCTTRKLDDTIFSPKEYITLKILDDNNFKYLHYKLDSIITYEYCEGTYKKEGNIYTIFPIDIGNRDFSYSLKQENIPNLKSKTKIRIETDIIGDDLDKYKILLKFDSKSITFQGVNIDTVINEKVYPNKISVEIFLPGKYNTENPTPSYKSISTAKFSLNEDSNFLDIKIPITYQMFYYKDPGITQIQDAGKYWLFVKSGKKIKKDIFKL